MKGRGMQKGVKDAKKDKVPALVSGNADVVKEAKMKKDGGKIDGKAKCHAGRMPRKNGGRTGADSNPYSSARHGTAPAGHKMGTMN